MRDAIGDPFYQAGAARVQDVFGAAALAGQFTESRRRVPVR